MTEKGYWEQVAEMERQNRDESEVEVARLQRRLKECQTQRDELLRVAKFAVGALGEFFRDPPDSWCANIYAGHAYDELQRAIRPALVQQGRATRAGGSGN